MAALIKAAKAEGTLNLIADPYNWANYGEIITSFSKTYGIKVNDVNQLGTSQQEITALQTLGSQSRAPDAVDVGQAYALDNASLFAPYKVATWTMIPAANKDPNGRWANDYGGYVSIGCNTSIVKVCPTSFAAMNNPMYKNDIALDNSPVTATPRSPGSGPRRWPTAARSTTSRRASRSSRSSTRTATSSRRPACPGRSRAGRRRS